MKRSEIALVRRLIITTFFLLFYILNFAATYYVSNSGNDSNSGLTSASPWKTLQKITDFTFKAGDNILFKRGNVFSDAQFRISESGTTGSPIIISAYGTGEKPEIRGWGEIAGWTTAGNWSEYSTGVWRMVKSLQTFRLWVNGKDKKQAQTLAITTDYPWRYETGYIYIKSATNPATTFNSLVDGTYRNRASDFSVNYLTFKNLKITGGSSANIRLLNCNNITIDSCEIGYRGFAGLVIQTTTAASSSDFIVNSCIMSSGDSLMYNYFKDPHTTTEAILLFNGVTNCKISNNYMYGWSHGGLFIKNTTTNYPCHDIEVSNNYVTAPLIDYARGFGCDYASNGYNVSFHDNTIESTSVCTQINGKGLKFYNNVIDNVRDTPYKYTGSPVNSGIDVSAYETPATDMEIYGNVIRNCQDHGIVMNSYSYGVSGINIHDNNIWNCGSFSIYAYTVTNLTNNIYSRNHLYSPSSTNTTYYSGAKTVTDFNSISTTNGDVISSNDGVLKFGIYTTTENELKIEHNATQLAKTISLSQPMVDSKGNKYSSIVTLLPFTSIVLIKDLTPIVVPDAPTSIVATAGNSSVSVSFVAPTNNGGSAITGYTVTSIPIGGTDSNAGSTALTHTITGLMNGISYAFTVKATNSVGTSVASIASNLVSPKAPVATGFLFIGPSSGSVNSASVNFTVTPNNSYTGTITITPTGTGSAGLAAKVLTFSNSAAAQTFTVTPTVVGIITLSTSNNGALTNPTNLTYNVNAIAPGTPVSVVAVAGNTTSSVSFLPPANNGGSVITVYSVTSLPADGVDLNAETTSLTHTITGLVNGTSYTFTVKASNSAGSSAASPASNAVTPVSVNSTEYKAICEGNSYNGWTMTGKYSRTLAAKVAGDSIVTTYLTVNPKYTISEDITIDEGLDYNGWTTSGQYSRALSSVSGCDSTVVINLTVVASSTKQGILYTQTIDLKKGYNMISTYVDASNSSVSTVTQPIRDNGMLIKMQDESGNSYENMGNLAGWVDTMGSILETEGYKIRVAADCSLQVTGTEITLPLDIPLNMGWNIVSFPRTDVLDGMNMIQSLIDQNILIKVQDEAGNSIENWGIYGGWKNSIGNFIPGKAYRVKVRANSVLTIQQSYPKSAILPVYFEQTSHFSSLAEGNGYEHMNINLVGLSGSALSIGDELAAYDGVACVGTLKITQQHLNQGSASLIASCATGSQLKDGFKEGASIQIRAWNQVTDSETPIQTSILSGSLNYLKNASTLVKMKTVTTSAFELMDVAQVEVFPNPSQGLFTVRFSDLPTNGSHIDIYDLSGRKVASHLIEGISEDFNLSDQAAGVYLVKSILGSQEKVSKLVIQ